MCLGVENAKCHLRRFLAVQSDKLRHFLCLSLLQLLGNDVYRGEICVGCFLKLYDFTSQNDHDLNEKRRSGAKLVQHVRFQVNVFLVLLPGNS